MRVRRLSVLVALFAMLMSLVAACGDDDDDDSAAPGTTAAGAAGATDTTGAAGIAPSGSVRGVTDTEIKLGGVASLTSPTGPLFGNADTGTKARLERANREGGINGRMIKYQSAADDGADPSRNLDIVRKLVLQDEVFALAPALSPVLLPQSTDFLAENHVPFVGWGITTGFCNNAYGVGFNGCLLNGTAVDNSLCLTVATALKMEKGVTVAYQGEDSAAADNGAPQNIQCWQDFGADVVYQENNIPATEVTDYSPYAQAIMTSDNGGPPDVAMLVSQFGSTVGVSGALKAAGFQGVIFNFITYLPGALGQLPDVAKALDGDYVTVQLLAQEFGGPAIERMTADLEAIGADPNIDLATAASYWAADVLVDLLTKAGRDLTPEGVAKLLADGYAYAPPDDPPGIGPISFPTAATDPSGCSSLVRHKGTEYEPILPLTCFPVAPQRPLAGS